MKLRWSGWRRDPFDFRERRELELRFIVGVNRIHLGILRWWVCLSW